MYPEQNECIISTELQLLDSEVCLLSKSVERKKEKKNSWVELKYPDGGLHQMSKQF